MAKKKAASGAKAPAVADDWGGTAAPKKKKAMGTGAKVGLGLAAAFVAVVLLGGGGGDPLTQLDPTNEEQLRGVFFSGEVWAVACQEDKKPLPDSVEAVAHRLAGEMKFGVVDCKAPMASGRTLKQRWKLKKEHADDPIMFLSNGVGVSQIGGSRVRGADRFSDESRRRRGRDVDNFRGDESRRWPRRG